MVNMRCSAQQGCESHEIGKNTRRWSHEPSIQIELSSQCKLSWSWIH